MQRTLMISSTPSIFFSQLVNGEIIKDRAGRRPPLPPFLPTPFQGYGLKLGQH